jgi:hypothetical protein
MSFAVQNEICGALDTLFQKMRDAEGFGCVDCGAGLA